MTTFLLCPVMFPSPLRCRFLITSVYMSPLVLHLPQLFIKFWTEKIMVDIFGGAKSIFGKATSGAVGLTTDVPIVTSAIVAQTSNVPIVTSALVVGAHTIASQTSWAPKVTSALVVGAHTIASQTSWAPVVTSAVVGGAHTAASVAKPVLVHGASTARDIICGYLRWQFDHIP